jgi:hypothetical protein
MASNNTLRQGAPDWDRAGRRKVHANAKLKNLAADDQETLWLLMHPTDDTVPPYTLEAALVYIQEEHGFSVALSTLSEWHAWYALNQRMAAAEERALQAKERYAMTNPAASLQELEDYAQFVFTSETLESRDVLNFGRLKKLRLVERAAAQKDELIELKGREVRQKDEVIAQNGRRIKLLEDTAAEAKSKLLAATSAAKSKGGLTPETLQAIEEAAGLL